MAAVKKRVLTPGKLRPQIDRVAAFRRGKLSAEQAYRIALTDVEEHEADMPDFVDSPQLNLFGPPPREGFEQKWMRNQIAGGTDWQNDLFIQRAGFQPRVDEMVGNKPLIVGDSILMERPIDKQRIEAARIARANANQLRSLLENEYTDSLAGNRGFGPLHISRESVTTEEVEIDF